MKRKLLSITLLTSLFFASCGGDKKDDNKGKEEPKKEAADKGEGNKEPSDKGKTDTEPSDKGESEKKSDIAVVTAKSGLSMRREPKTTAKFVSLLPSNAIVKIVETGEEATIKGKTAPWYKVEYGGKEGYVFGAYLSMGDKVKATSSANAETAGENAGTTAFGGAIQKALITAKSGLTLREEGSQSGKALVNVPKNSEVAILEFGENPEEIKGLQGVWCKARYGKKEGYLFSAYLCLSTATVTAKSGLKIRENPMTDQRELGVIPFGKEVYLLPPSNMDDPEPDNFFMNEMGETWYRVRYGKIEGWASAQFLEIPEGC